MAKELYSIMREHGFSIRTLTEALDGEISKSTIQNILRGHRPGTPDKPLDIQPPTMKAIVRVLGVEINDVLEFVEANQRAESKENRVTGLNRHAVYKEAVAVPAAAVSPQF